MRRLIAAVVVPAALAAASIADAAPPPPTPVWPSPDYQFRPPTRAVTFKVDGQVEEGDGALHVEFTDADGSIDETGRYQNDEGGVDDYALKQVAPGGNRYEVRVPASAFERYSGGPFYWHAYRMLPAGSCTPVPNSTRQDCFQESEQRTFENSTPAGWGAYEPNDSARKATSSKDFFNHDCAYLEKRSDVDWYRYATGKHGFKLRFKLDNSADSSDRWKPLRSRRRESADMSVSLYRTKGHHHRARGRKIASKHVPVGKTRVLRKKLRARTAYLIAVRHAGNGFRHAKPATDLQYFFDANFPGPFSDANGCA